MFHHIKVPFGLLFVALFFRAAHAQSIIVDPKKAAQTFEGWGMSLAWAANTLYPGNGIVENQVQWDSIMESIYGSDGLAFNIARYNIGGGENPDYRYLFAINPNYLMDGFLNLDQNWNINADSPQIAMLKKAKALGANLFEAFSNSPPWFMLKSRSVTGAVYLEDNANGETGAWDNLFNEDDEAFTNYLADAVEFVQERSGISFRTLDPFNESRPITRYWLFEQNFPSGKVQEGCHFSIAHQNRVILNTRKALQARGLTTEISGPDETGIDLTRSSFEGYSPEAQTAVAQINTHSYQDGDREALQALANKNGKRLWMTEFGIWGDGMNTTLDLANQILRDLNSLGAQAWIIWQPDSGPINYTGGNPVTKNKAYYGLQQFSKFVKPGVSILKSDEITQKNTLLAYDPKKRQLVLVTVNTSDEDSLDTHADLSAFGYVDAVSEIYMTTSDQDMIQSRILSSVRGPKALDYTTPRRAITTALITVF